MVLPDQIGPPIVPIFHQPATVPARPPRPPRQARPLNPLAPAFVPAQAPVLPQPPVALNPAAQPFFPARPPPPPPAAADWWEETAKPAIISFCKGFAASRAIRRYQIRRLVSRALELALAAQDWAKVASARARLAALNSEAAAGTAIRAHTPLADSEEPADFHHQAERRGGGLHWPLCCKEA